MYERLSRSVADIRKITDFKPEVALVLGSGLGDYAEGIQVVDYVEYKAIEGFPISTIQGHAGRFVFGYVGEVPVVIMQGRVHYYEGYSMEDVVLPVRLMRMLGAKKLILTNAAGGINETFTPGTFMMITDHIAVNVPNPLIGPNIDELGPRFPSVSEMYTPRLQEVVRTAADTCGISLREGIYLQLSGPSYETPAEIRMARIMGADAVGMSTACEAIAACHMGMEICGISCITNMSAGIEGSKLSHEDVQLVAERGTKDFKALITEIIKTM